MTDVASPVSASMRWKISMTDLPSVFSAPKYCDSTENKGAYINIGPEHNLDYHKFDAVPHPDIKPMVTFLPRSFDFSADVQTRHMRKIHLCR